MPDSTNKAAGRRELHRKMATGALWTSLMRVSVRGLGLISMMIMARLLLPADFGLVAMATSVVAFLELATAFNFDIPLIQNQDAERRHFDSAWTLNFLFYAGLTIVLVVLARPAALFYHEARLTSVIYVLAAGFFVRGFENVGVVNFRKQLNFQVDFLLMFSKKLIGVLVAVPLAFYLRSYWALVAGIVASDVVGIVLTYVAHPFRPRFSLAAAGEMLNFSKWLVLNSSFNFLRLRSPDFVVGRISGASALGLFNIAFEISTLATIEVVAPINRAVFPGYAKLAKDLGSLRESYLDVLAIIALVALPAGFGVSAIAPELVQAFLGSKWQGAVPLVQLLAVFGSINAIQTNSVSVFNAIGKPHLIAVLGSMTVALLLGTCIPLALAYGPKGVAVGYLCAFVAAAPPTFYVICRQIQIRAGALAGVLWRPFLGSFIMYAAVEVARTLLPPQALGSIEKLVILVPLGALTYAGSVLALWAGAGRPPSAEYRLGRLAIRRLLARRRLQADGAAD